MKMRRHLGNEDVIDTVVGKCGKSGDESGIAPHDFYQSNPVGMALGLAMGTTDDSDRFSKSSLESKTLVHVFQIIVDGLRDAYDADLKSSPGDLFNDTRCSTQGPVTTDHEENGNAQLHEPIDDLFLGLRSPGCS